MDALELVKARLGITSSKRDDYLEAIISGVLAEIQEIQGIKIDDNNAAHLMFIVDYSVFRYENKGESGGLPRHLQWRLHNLFVGERNDI